MGDTYLERLAADWSPGRGVAGECLTCQAGDCAEHGRRVVRTFAFTPNGVVEVSRRIEQVVFVEEPGRSVATDSTKADHEPASCASCGGTRWRIVGYDVPGVVRRVPCEDCAPMPSVAPAPLPDAGAPVLTPGQSGGTSAPPAPEATELREARRLAARLCMSAMPTNHGDLLREAAYYLETVVPEMDRQRRAWREMAENPKEPVQSIPAPEATGEMSPPHGIRCDSCLTGAPHERDRHCYSVAQLLEHIAALRSSREAERQRADRNAVEAADLRLVLGCAEIDVAKLTRERDEAREQREDLANEILAGRSDLAAANARAEEAERERKEADAALLGVNERANRENAMRRRAEAERDEWRVKETEARGTSMSLRSRLAAAEAEVASLKTALAADRALCYDRENAALRASREAERQRAERAEVQVRIRDRQLADQRLTIDVRERERDEARERLRAVTERLQDAERRCTHGGEHPRCQCDDEMIRRLVTSGDTLAIELHKAHKRVESAQAAEQAANARAEEAERNAARADEQAAAMIASLDTERAARLKAEGERDEAKAPFVYCPECDSRKVAIDSDGCCATCGTEALVTDVVARLRNDHQRLAAAEAEGKRLKECHRTASETVWDMAVARKGDADEIAAFRDRAQRLVEAGDAMVKECYDWPGLVSRWLAAKADAPATCKDGLPHSWGTDGAHANEFCKVCYVDRPKGGA